MPMRMGGGGHTRVEDLEATSRANGGSLLFGDADTEIGLYHRVCALMIAQGFVAARHRALQADPLRASDEARPVPLPDGTTPTLSPLERWEASLRLRPTQSATVTERRAAVAARRALTGKSTRATIRTLLEGVFGTWTLVLYDYTVLTQPLPGSYWPSGAGTPSYPGDPAPDDWISDCYKVYGAAYAPAGTSAIEKARRVAQAYALLDDILPGHCTYQLLTP